MEKTWVEPPWPFLPSSRVTFTSGPQCWPEQRCPHTCIGLFTGWWDTSACPHCGPVWWPVANLSYCHQWHHSPSQMQRGCNWCVRTPAAILPLLCCSPTGFSSELLILLASPQASQHSSRRQRPPSLQACVGELMFGILLRGLTHGPCPATKCLPPLKRNLIVPFQWPQDLGPWMILRHQHKDFYFQVKLNCQHASCTEIRDRTAFLCTGIAVRQYLDV